ncbi:alanine racemase [Candidatus Marimicrobium litorale]|uniref:Alanine racemase n=1 Tax=Candidatus Marimicrobium litorale TaxID=2518991 RepID=A0ABT3T1F6_9GAMM|nr:alanine racemase [Candidatus Marimicrobium litorale]MCX2976088.1 alanine racemase [Candidatus Marimicrobium litorale]
MARPNQATLDLDALRHNVVLTRQLAPDSRLMAVIKANAYGHGMTVIGKALQPQVDALAVACIEEAVELRDAGITVPILLLEGVFEPAELALAARLQLWLTIANERQLEWLEQSTLTQPVSCWLKIDTGMNRKGVPTDRAMACHRRLLECGQVRADPVSFTHFATADDLDAPLTQRQLQRFDQLTVSGPRSAANSAGVLAWPNSHYDWIRPGYMLYGHSPMLETHPAAQALRPVMTLSSAVVAVRDLAAGESVGYGCTWVAARPSRIATVTIGYGDGYPRNAPNGTPVLINGQRAPLAGRVSMDMITVDVTDLEAVQAGDTVILWGQTLPLAEIAKRADTIGYELTTRMPARTPRIIA